ncbi:protein-(glutamine-N5) methyltransferase, release factor-specific [Bacterioplanes sanyensis]|uniref:Release factor glutamine methyltransferase n=1 Tax=Bacterioplanes sanyensis TaxID=1249553 RepID=A0A222FEK8_9GAMM|nr:peptide chain release factor N(5)-glutamine methyltransferase [Bacterioplanes sanyensis]ASP37190.1 protein-(glutamine-N5) methyltransferase, release factor-specific [Bacterioplanes sanyensis]
MQIEQWLRWASAQLEASDSARLDAELLLAHVLDKDRTWLYTWSDRTLSSSQQDSASELLDQRMQGIPVAHLLGQREFWSLPLAVNASTLIPRGDTETLVEWVLDLALPANARVLDLGTGTGAIALALASEKPGWHIEAVDAQADAVALATSNAERLNLPVKVYRSDWFTAVEGRFDVIVSNPPYIDADDEHLQQDDVRFEPRSALVAANNGLADLNHIQRAAPAYLNDHGWLLLEHGWQQAPAVSRALTQQGFQQVTTRRDLGGQARITGGQWSVNAANRTDEQRYSANTEPRSRHE